MSFSKVAQPSRLPSNLFSFLPVQAGRLRYIEMNYKDVAPTALNAAFFWI